MTTIRKKRIAIRLTPELHDWLATEAARLGESMSAVAARAVRKALESRYNGK